MWSSPAKPSKLLTLLAVCIGTFMLIVDVQIIVVALPSIHRALSISLSDEQWTIDAYALSLAALLLPMGSLADIVGRRRVFAIGLAGFTAGSLLCGIATSGPELVTFRALQGIGGAIVFATSLALLAQTFAGAELGMAIAAFSAVVNLGLGTGPVLGGLLTNVSWRWIFFANIPLGLVAIVMTLVGVQEYRPPKSRRIDVPGSAVFTLALVGLIYGLIESGETGWGSARVVLALTVAVIAFGSFLLIERARREPMFDLTLTRIPTFNGGLIAAFAMNGSLYAIMLFLVLYLQNGLHYSALGTGIRLLVITGASTVASLVVGRLTRFVTTRWMISVGLALIGIGLLLMRGLDANSSWTHLIVGMAIAGVGGGLVNPGLSSTAVGVVPPEDAGMASGVNATMRQVGIAAAIAVLGVVFDHQLAGGGPVTGRYASALDIVLLITACLALVAAALSAVLIRQSDFRSRKPEPERDPESVPVGHRPGRSTS